MWSAIVFAVLALAATVTAAWDKLSSGKKPLVIFAVIAVLTAMLSQAGQLWEKYAKFRELEQQMVRSNDADVLIHSELVEIDEASGGAVDSATGIAYIVDDEKTALFAMKYDPAARAYSRRDRKPIPLVDRREVGVEHSRTLDKDDVTDLEGAAFHDGHLYLISTLGNSNEGTQEQHREWVLQVTLAGDVLNASSRLRPIIERYFVQGLPCSEGETVEPWRDDAKKQVMRVEGLAIDKDGWVYIGFRAPLVRNQYALVLRTRREGLFENEPQFESFLLRLSAGKGEYYGITSLDYDAKDDKILVMGNHPNRKKVLPPRIWTWTPSSTCREMQQVAPLQGHIFSSFGEPGSRPAKPEVVLALAPDLLHIFFDAEGNGGQLSLARNGDRLTQLREPRLMNIGR